MKRLKQHLLPGVIVTIGFLLLLLMSTMIQSQLAFFSTYQNIYDKSIAKIEVQGLQFDAKRMKQVLDDVLDDTSIVEFYLPRYNAKASLTMIYPQEAIPQFNELKKTADVPHYLIAGKEAYPSVAKDIRNQKLSIYDTPFDVTGILPQSPYDHHLVLFSDMLFTDARVQSNITSITVRSESYEKAQTQLYEILSVIDERLYIGQMSEQSSSLSQQDISQILAEYRQLFLLLVLVILLCMGIHYYQRFDLWRMEFAVRKMIGAHTIQLVIDTFKKFLFLSAASFIAALVIYFGTISLFPWIMPLTLLQRWWALFHIFVLFVGLLAIFLLLSILYVRKVSVTAMFMEVDE